MILANVIKWCREDVSRMQEQLQSLKSGGKLQSFINGKQTDVTDDWVEIYEKRIVEMKALIARYSEEKKA